MKHLLREGRHRRHTAKKKLASENIGYPYRKTATGGLAENAKVREITLVKEKTRAPKKFRPFC